MNQHEFDKYLGKVPRRQLKVLKLLLQNKSPANIAGELEIEISTVNAHLSHTYQIFGIAREHNNCDGLPKDKLIELFCQFKIDWVAHSLRKKFVSRKADEYFDVKNISCNLFLLHGIDCFNEKRYEDAIDLFKTARSGDPTDPLAEIFLNNAKARLRGLPLVIAVVVAYSRNEFHVDASNNVLRGVADCQVKFNDSAGESERLLEVILADDHNNTKYAERLAMDLSKDEDILGIIGHHSSEGTRAALPIYRKESIALVSPTSTSSNIKGENFFRTIGSTKEIANTYAMYIKQYMNLDKIIVFYHKNNEYSQTLKDDFEESFKALAGKVVGTFSNLNDPRLDIRSEIEEIIEGNIAKAVLVISSIESNFAALAIANENSNLGFKRLQLLFSTALPELPALKKGRDALEGSLFIHPDLANESDYVKQAKNRWEAEDINWRVVTGYNATQALIEATILSKNPTRKEILKNLEAIDLPGKNRKYCISQVHQHGFKVVSIN
jgi:ABC-type branched-subunit amino acid transport system substrate-binding protein